MTATYQTRGDVAVITLANPPVNGLGYETRLGIVNGLEQALNDAAVKAIVITGAGKAFSGGADIREFGSPKAVAEPNLLSVILALEASSKPIVAAIHSVAMGGGLELALGCHYRVTAPGAQIALPEVKIGLIPGDGGAWLLPRVIGMARASELLYTGDTIDAQTALSWGLVSKVVPAATLMDEALKLANRMAAQPPDVLRMTKRLLREGQSTSFDNIMELSAAMQSLAHHTEDHAEAVNAFFEKRPGNYTGR